MNMPVEKITEIFNLMIKEGKEYGTAANMSAADWMAELSAYVAGDIECNEELSEDEIKSEMEELSEVCPNVL